MPRGVTIQLDHARPLLFDATGLMVAERIAERSIQEIFAMFVERKVPMYIWVAMLTGALTSSMPAITERLTVELLNQYGQPKDGNFNAKLAWAAQFIMEAFNEAFPNPEAPEEGGDAVNPVTTDPEPPRKMQTSGTGTPSSE